MCAEDIHGQYGDKTPSAKDVHRQGKKAGCFRNPFIGQFSDFSVFGGATDTFTSEQESPTFSQDGLSSR